MNTGLLFEWYKENARNLPWRKTTDPYKIWVSEIILQQTRVNQGIDYYHRFLKNFPVVESLAKAPEKQVLKIWEGLGYYSRARNMHQTAKIIMEKYEGKFPSTYTELLQLKGIGPYTAAAIASFAFGRKIPAIDGNVLRVMSRLYGIQVEINTRTGLKIFQEKARKIIDPKQPALFNQALMEFGALICTPASPACPQCVFKNSCVALQTGKVKQLPHKKKKKKPVSKFFHFFLIENQDKFLIEKRTGNGIWKNLYQLPLWEKPAKENLRIDRIPQEIINKYQLREISRMKKITSVVHSLSHQKLHISFWQVHTSAGKGLFIRPGEIENYPFPQVIAKFLDNYFN